MLILVIHRFSLIHENVLFAIRKWTSHSNNEHGNGACGLRPGTRVIFFVENFVPHL